MPDFAVKTAFTATDKVSPAFKRMGKGADKFGNRAKNSFIKADRGANRFVSSMKSMLPVLSGAALIAIGKRAIDLASDLTEVQNVVDVTFGKGADQINKFASTAITKFGLSELKAKEFSSTLGAIIKPSGIAGQGLVDMAQNLTGLVGDFVSFRNLRPEESFEKIRAGITGETEPLKSLGIVMTQANLKAFALDIGIRKNIKSMSEAEKVMLRYKFIMAKSKDAQGDFNRTLKDSFANQQKVLSARFDQFLANIAVSILPALTSGFATLNDIMKRLDPDAFATGLKFIGIAAGIAASSFILYKTALIAAAAWQAAIVAAGWISFLIQMLPLIRASIKAQGLWNFMLKGTAAWETIVAAKTAILTAATWLWNAALNANPIGLIILGIAALIAIGVLLWRNWETVKEVILGALTAMWEGITSFASGAVAAFSAVGGAIMSYLLFPINLLITGIIKLLQVASSIPGIGDTFAKAALKAQEFQRSANAAVGSTNVFAPNDGTTQNINLEGNINISGAPKGSTASSKVTGAKPIAMNMIGANE